MLEASQQYCWFSWLSAGERGQWYGSGWPLTHRRNTTCSWRRYDDPHFSLSGAQARSNGWLGLACEVIHKAWLRKGFLDSRLFPALHDPHIHSFSNFMVTAYAYFMERNSYARPRCSVWSLQTVHQWTELDESYMLLVAILLQRDGWV